MAGNLSHSFVKVGIHTVIATQLPCRQCNLLSILSRWQPCICTVFIHFNFFSRFLKLFSVRGNHVFVQVMELLWINVLAKCWYTFIYEYTRLWKPHLQWRTKFMLFFSCIYPSYPHRVPATGQEKKHATRCLSDICTKQKDNWYWPADARH